MLQEPTTITINNQLELARELLANQPSQALKSALAIAEQTINENRGMALTIACQAEHNLNHFLPALKYGTEAISLIPNTKPVARANALSALGAVQLPLGNYEAALALFKEAYQLYTEHQHLEGILESTARLARIQINVGQPARAFEILQNILEKYSSNAQPSIKFRLFFEAAHANAYLYHETKETEYAKKSQNYIEQAQQSASEANNPKLSIGLRNNIAPLYALLDQQATLEQLSLELLSEAQTNNDTPHIMSCLINLGHSALQQQNYSQAQTRSLAALNIAKEQQNREAELTCLDNLATSHEHLGQHQQALIYFKQFYALETQLRSEKAEFQAQVFAMQFELERTKNEAKLHRIQNFELEQRVQERTTELEQAQLEMLERLAIAAEYRDYDTGTHTQRVGEATGAIATALGLPSQEVNRLRLAARLHDIGKISIPDSILLNRDELSSAQWAIIRAHTIVGAKMLEGSQSALMHLAEEIALSHHERFDGTGYPMGLSGESIPLSGRITAVADVFDALLSERPYKHAWTRADAITEIRKLSGSHFDPRVVTAFLTTV